MAENGPIALTYWAQIRKCEVRLKDLQHVSTSPTGLHQLHLEPHPPLDDTDLRKVKTGKSPFILAGDLITLACLMA